MNRNGPAYQLVSNYELISQTAKMEQILRRFFIEKINKIKKEKSIRVDDFAKRYGLDVQS